MNSLLDNAFELLERATKLEKEAPIEAATKYFEASYLMKRYLQQLPITPNNSQTRELLLEKVTHYKELAGSLLENQENNGVQHKQEPESPFSKHCQFFDDTSVVALPAPTAPSPWFQDSSVQPTLASKAAQANTKLAHSLDVDESGNKDACIQEYMAAAELFLEAIKMAESAGDEAASVASLLKRRLACALDQVEELKHPNQRAVVREQKLKEQRTQQGSPHSQAEIAILKWSSLIASGLFLPWSDVDAQKLSEEAQKPNTVNASPWTDPDGYLKLSDKQRDIFANLLDRRRFVS